MEQRIKDIEDKLNKLEEYMKTRESHDYSFREQQMKMNAISYKVFQRLAHQDDEPKTKA